MQGLDRFLKHLNSQNCSIKLIMELERIVLPLLAVQIYKESAGQLRNRVNRKPTDTHFQNNSLIRT